MGITGIWDHVSKYCDTVSIDTLQGCKLAIDGNIWLYESTKGTQSHRGSANSFLVTFFNRIQRLREHKIEVIVVFDDVPGQYRGHSSVPACSSPRKKKDKMDPSFDNDFMREYTHRFSKVQDLLRNMGVYVVVSLSDGEAQAAHLEQSGLVSGCITPDFDYFLFGGSNLYKFEFLGGGRSVSPSVLHLSMETLVNNNLTRNRLIALGMLIGCDYMEGGIGGVGIVTALEILGEFSIHDDDHAITILDRFNSYCRAEVPIRDTDSLVKKKFRKDKFRIPHGFPNIELYGDVAQVFLDPSVVKVTDVFNGNSSFSNDGVFAIFRKECGWTEERFNSEMAKSLKHSQTITVKHRQSKISDFFPNRRKKSVKAVVEECSTKEQTVCSQREWAALARLRQKASLYALEPVIVDGVPLKRKIQAAIDTIVIKKNKTPIVLLEDETPTTSTQQPQLVNDETISKDDSSVIFLH